MGKRTDQRVERNKFINDSTKDEMIVRMQELADKIDDLNDEEKNELRQLQSDWMDDTMRRASVRIAKANNHVKFTPPKKKRKKRKKTHR